MDISKNKYRASVHRHTGGFYLKYYGIIYFDGCIFGKGYPNILKEKSKLSSCRSFHPSYLLMSFIMGVVDYAQKIDGFIHQLRCQKQNVLG